MLKLNNTQNKIISALVLNGSLSKRELCEYTGLSWAGISKGTACLHDSGVIIYGEKSPLGGAGRPPLVIDLNPKSYSAGISIAYSKVEVAICNLKGELVSSGCLVYNRDDDPVPEALKLLSLLLTDEFRRNLISVGISFPGLIDSSKRIVESSVYFSEFYKRPVAEEFETALQLDIPVFIERNAVCSLTDLVINKKHDTDCLLISLSSGVSAAAFVDNKILDGKTGNLAMLGHFPHPENRIPCLCRKTGCIETLTGEVAWSRDYRKISKLPDAEKSFYSSIEKGMPQAVKMLSYSLESLVPALKQLLNIFNPEVLFFAADLPPSSALIFSTLFSQLLPDFHGEINLTEKLSSSRGAAALGTLHLCGKI